MKQLEQHDIEWANDWNKIVEIYEAIDDLKKLFNALDTTYLRQMQQQVLISNLEKYAWSLQNYIIEKYSKI
ncbi:MAG: hypothetical protein ACFFAS_10155 [Promethearchaeota archaeon]